jgi:phage-related protein
MRLVWDAVWDIVKHYILMMEQLMRVFVAWAKTLWDNFGKTILKFVQKAWGAISTFIEGALKFIQGIIQIVTGIIKGDWTTIWNGIKNVFVGVWEAIKGSLELSLAYIQFVIQGALDAITLAWNLCWTAIKLAFEKAWELVKTVVSKGIDEIVLFFYEFPDRIEGAVSTLADAIKSPFVVAFNAIKTLWNNTVGGFGFTVPSWIPKVGGKGFKIPYIGSGGDGYGGGVTGSVDAFFANGGFVNGPTVAMIGEAGPELVLPLTRPARTQELLSEHGLAGGGASVTNINVTARTDADPDAIAQQVAWQIRVGGI